jgi:uncharacterized protein (TIGR02145 family)
VTYEGETYQTVVIGTQTWMAKNLNYDTGTDGSKCYYDYYCTTYGKQYDWATAMALPSNCNSSTCSSQVGTKHKGICPSGWHIPSDAEWTTLTDFVGGLSTAVTKLRSTSGWGWNGDDGGTDNYGFSALPGGIGSSNGVGSVGYIGRWWSSTESTTRYALLRDMSDSSTNSIGDSKGVLCSVRCVQD